MSRPITVLYIDDEPDIREIALMSLALDPDIQAQPAASGAAALALLESRILVPDIILLDVMMPGLDGPSVLKQIRTMSWLDACKVVFITARAREKEKDRFLAMGAAAVITKPFDPMSLAKQVRALWGGEA